MFSLWHAQSGSHGCPLYTASAPRFQVSFVQAEVSGWDVVKGSAPKQGGDTASVPAQAMSLKLGRHFKVHGNINS